MAPLESPPSGETPPQAAEGVHFQRPSGRLYGFNYILIARQGDTFPFEPSAPFEPYEPITANDSSVPSSIDTPPKLIPYKFFSFLLQWFK